MEKNSEAGKLERNGFGNEHAKKNRITQNMRTSNDQNHIGHSVYRTNNSHIDEKMLFREFNKT